MPDDLVPTPGHLATTNMHVGLQLPTCEWARKVVEGQGNILANYSQMIFTLDQGFEESYIGYSHWKEVVEHRVFLPLLATHFGISLAAKIRISPTLGSDPDDDLTWGAAVGLRHNASGELFWHGTASFVADRNDVYAGTRMRFFFDAEKEGVLASGHMNELWRVHTYLKNPANTDYVTYMRTWAHAYYGAYLPLK